VNNVPAQEELRGGDVSYLEVSTSIAQMNNLPMKRTILHALGKRKKMKAQKSIPELTLIEDDIDLVVEKVQDCVAEVWYDTKKKQE